MKKIYPQTMIMMVNKWPIACKLKICFNKNKKVLLTTNKYVHPHLTPLNYTMK